MNRDPILLLGDESLMGEPSEQVERAENAGIIFACPYESPTDPSGRLVENACGFAHWGDGFYHLCEGRTIEDYEALDEPVR